MSGIAIIRAEAHRFGEVRNLKSFLKLFDLPPLVLIRKAMEPSYSVYSIPKKNGGKRLIEDPEDELKAVLRRLNQYLQATYHKIRPDCVHGFCISASTEEDRNIVSNANRHLGKAYMLNIDLKDFFHTINEQRVSGIWEQHFAHLHSDVAALLTKLCCYRGRLPMGSPTSPVLSNYAALGLDAELITLSKASGIRYSRFADDLTFSADFPISDFDIQLIRDSIVHFGFTVNEQKVKYYQPGDIKMVTGIIVGEGELSLPQDYLDSLEKEIDRYRQVMITEARFQTGMSHKKLNLFRLEILSKWNFAQMVMGENEKIVSLRIALDEALNPTEAYESESWLELPYTFL